MVPQRVNVLLTDTCSVYKLYFFASKGIIPSTNILIANFGRVEFHPIVAIEFEEDLDVYHLFQSLKPQPKFKGYPSFFDDLGGDILKKLDKFISENITQIQPSLLNDKIFLVQKRIYDDFRIKLQHEWKLKGIFQESKKAVSEPTDEDYLLVYDALKNDVELITNDEILLDVANHFLGIQRKKTAYMAEHVIKAVYKLNPSLKHDIDECIGSLGYLNEKFQPEIVFK